jgi:TetR/AcrR family transcriptional repressor of nem operon
VPVQKIEKSDFLLRCWEVFHKQGYYNTSMQELANATGLQKAGLYHHYPTKQQLMERVMEFALEQFRSYVLSVADDLTLPPEQRLEKILRRHRRLATLHRQGCFFANVGLETGQEELFNHVLLRSINEWIEAVARLLSHVMEPAEAKVQAQRLIMEYEGVILFYKITGDEKFFDDFIARTVRLMSTHAPVGAGLDD